MGYIMLTREDLNEDSEGYAIEDIEVFCFKNNEGKSISDFEKADAVVFIDIERNNFQMSVLKNRRGKLGIIKN